MSGIVTVTRLMSSLGIKNITGFNWFIFDSFECVVSKKKSHDEIAGIIISLQNNPSFQMLTMAFVFNYVVMWFCLGALSLMSNPALFKLSKPTTGGQRRIWFQINTTFLFVFDEDDRPCVPLSMFYCFWTLCKLYLYLAINFPPACVMGCYRGYK